MFQFPTIFDWIERLSFLQGMPAAYLTLLTAFIIVVVWDWRVNIFALALQYFLTAILFVDVLDPRLAVVKLLVGWFICLMLYFTARQAQWGRIPNDVTEEEAEQLQSGARIRLGRWHISYAAPFRILLGLMMALVVFTVAQRPAFQLPAVSGPINLAIYALAGMGLLGLSLTSDPLKAGIGLLTFITGFELFYNTLEQSVAMLAFLAGGNLALTLAISYLTQVRHSLPVRLREKVQH